MGDTAISAGEVKLNAAGIRAAVLQLVRLEITLVLHDNFVPTGINTDVLSILIGKRKKFLASDAVGDIAGEAVNGAWVTLWPKSGVEGSIDTGEASPIVVHVVGQAFLTIGQVVAGSTADWAELTSVVGANGVIAFDTGQA